MEFLKNFIPYCIRWDANRNYYILNRYYIYIGTDSGSCPPGFEYIEQYYLFNDSTSPYKSDPNFKQVCLKFDEIKKSLGTCLNSNNTILTIDDIIQNNCITMRSDKIHQLFMNWIEEIGIQLVNVHNEIIWYNEKLDTWQTLETFILKYKNRLTKSIKTYLPIYIKSDESWYNRKRYQPKLDDYELPEFNITTHLSSSIVTDYNVRRLLKFCIKTFNLKSFPKKTSLSELLRCYYNTGESVWCFNKNNQFYIFGDMYGDPRKNIGLVNFLRDTMLYRHTSFYKWNHVGEPPYYVNVGNQNLNFHRTHVWIARLPSYPYNEKSPNHKKFVGLLRCIPMLMLWRKRAAEYCFHPSRVCFDIDIDEIH